MSWFELTDEFYAMWKVYWSSFSSLGWHLPRELAKNVEHSKKIQELLVESLKEFQITGYHTHSSYMMHKSCLAQKSMLLCWCQKITIFWHPSKCYDLTTWAWRASSNKANLQVSSSLELRSLGKWGLLLCTAEIHRIDPTEQKTQNMGILVSQKLF